MNARVELLLAMLLVAACSRSNNLLQGRVESRLGEHAVVVTDCYRTSVPAPAPVARAADGSAIYRWTPCRDADVVITGAQLAVNGTSYGVLRAGDRVIVDHGVVRVER